LPFYPVFLRKELEKSEKKIEKYRMASIRDEKQP